MKKTADMSKRAYDAITDWEKSTGAMYIGGPFFARAFNDTDFVTLEIKNSSQGIRLSLIKTPPQLRGKGLASRALKELLQFADKHGVPVTGTVDPQEDDQPVQGKPPLNKASLKKWYGRHGFKNQPYDEITRTPAAARVVEALLESDEDEFDIKNFVNRATVLNVGDLQRAIGENVPGIAVPTVHVLKPYPVEVRGVGQDHGPVTVMERQEIYLYYAREPRSNNGFDPENYPSSDE